MRRYNEFRTRSFIEHLVVGFFAVLLGIGILMPIISEIRREYRADSKYAYFLGIIVCALIIAMGVWFVRRGFNIQKRVFKGFSQAELSRAVKQMNSATTDLYDKYMILTDDYIVTCRMKLDSQIDIIRIKDLAACFNRPMYGNDDDIVQYDLVLAKRDLKPIVLRVKGKIANAMPQAYDQIIGQVPWVLNNETDDMNDFMDNYKKHKNRRAFLRTVEHRKAMT
ncbi:MAG: hypothetical protein IJL97_04480 [Lachnospiraceae bacterium]|nr:hypothetical protein [Lachnospiraceae bacterium]